MGVLSIIESLGITGLQYNALSALVESDLSANAILERLKGTEAAIQRTRGLAAIREMRGIISTRPYVASVNLNSRLDPSRIPTSLTTQKRQYSYRMQLTVINANTGERDIVTRNISSSELLTKQEAIDALTDVFSEGVSSSGVEFESATVIQVTQSLPE